MTESQLSSIELMRLHVEALYTFNEQSRLCAVNQWDGGVVPRFFLGRTDAGNLWRFRDDMPDELAMALETLCRDEPATSTLSQPPVHQEKYARLLAADESVEQIYTGPAYWLPKNVIPDVYPVAMTAENAALLNGGLEDWLPDIPHRHPFMAMIEEGHAVSVCASVRMTDAAHEAGVETLKAYRRRGHAVKVVAGWAAEVRKIGAIPLYSTSWDNVASQSVAARLGASMFGTDFHIT